MFRPILYDNVPSTPEFGEMAVMDTLDGAQTALLPQSDVGSTGVIAISNIGTENVTVTGRGGATFRGISSYVVAAGYVAMFAADGLGRYMILSSALNSEE